MGHLDVCSSCSKECSCLKQAWGIVFAALIIILVVSMMRVNFLSAPGIQHLALLTAGQDIQMLKELDLAEDFEIIDSLEA